MPDLHKELSEKGADLLWQVVSGYPKTFENPMKQNDKDATYGRRFKKVLKNNS